MSVPHTGKLKAEIAGITCEFDGHRWSCGDAALADTLNTALELCPTQHVDISSLARQVFRAAGVEGRIVEAKSDRWTGDLPEGAVD